MTWQQRALHGLVWAALLAVVALASFVAGVGLLYLVALGWLAGTA